MLGSLRNTLFSWRTFRLWLVAFLACLGVISAIAGLISALLRDPFKSQGGLFLSIALAFCLAFATARSWPSRSFSRSFSVPGTEVSVRVGDLFDQQGHLIIGMTDTFDTDTDVVARGAVQGQLLERVYYNDVVRLDAELDEALKRRQATRLESSKDKSKGKLKRYPLGTVAVIGPRERRLFCVAYSEMDNNSFVQSSADDLWLSLSAAWEAVRQHAERGTVSIPVIGAGLARVGNLSRSDLVKLIIMSFLAASRERVVTDRLQIIIHPDSLEMINLRELEEFLLAY